MEHLQRYLQAQWVVENPHGYDERDVIDAKKYCDAYMDGYNHAVNAYNQARLSDIEQLQFDEEANKCKRCQCYGCVCDVVDGI